MDIVLTILAGVCLIVGLIGCVVPFIPGPPVAYLGLLLVHLTDMVQYSYAQLFIWLAVVVVVQVLDYVVPTIGSKYSGGSRWGMTGCLIGTIIGLFFLPLGIILGPFLGAFLGELIGGRRAASAVKSGFGALVGFLVGVVLKFVVCAYFIWRAACSIVTA